LGVVLKGLSYDGFKETEYAKGEWVVLDIRNLLPEGVFYV
jgi:hypothetical protein